jgi:hypothetical protein
MNLCKSYLYIQFPTLFSSFQKYVVLTLEMKNKTVQVSCCILFLSHSMMSYLHCLTLYYQNVELWPVNRSKHGTKCVHDRYSLTHRLWFATFHFTALGALLCHIYCQTSLNAVTTDWLLALACLFMKLCSYSTGNCAATGVTVTCREVVAICWTPVTAKQRNETFSCEFQLMKGRWHRRLDACFARHGHFISYWLIFSSASRTNAFTEQYASCELQFTTFALKSAIGY